MTYRTPHHPSHEPLTVEAQQKIQISNLNVQIPFADQYTLRRSPRKKPTLSPIAKIQNNIQPSLPQNPSSVSNTTNTNNKQSSLEPQTIITPKSQQSPGNNKPKNTNWTTNPITKKIMEGNEKTIHPNARHHVLGAWDIALNHAPIYSLQNIAKAKNFPELSALAPSNNDNITCSACVAGKLIRKPQKRPHQ